MKIVVITILFRNNNEKKAIYHFSAAISFFQIFSAYFLESSFMELVDMKRPTMAHGESAVSQFRPDSQ